MYNIIANYITPNKYSRPQRPLKQVKAIVIHYLANPNSTALQNRNYFDSLKNQSTTYASAHEIIDLKGDIVVCVPDNEITFNCGSKTYTQRCLKELGNSPNNCTYGIEFCHINDKGEMTKETYNTLVDRCYNLCKKYKLNSNNIWMHKEVVGWKCCPKFFCDNPIEWTKFKSLVQKMLDNDKKIVQAKNIVVKEVLSMFKDINSVAEYARPSVIKLKEIGIIKGDSEGNVNPKNAVTLEQLAVVMDRVITYLESEIKK